MSAPAGGRFWETRCPGILTPAQWERLCDGCARCCLLSFEDEQTGTLYRTRIVCQYLEMHSCRCTIYGERTDLVPTCVRLRPENLERVYFMPPTCAYRLLAEGRALPGWHPLVSGDPESVHRAGMSVRGRAIPENYVHPDDWERYVIDLDDL